VKTKKAILSVYFHNVT